MTDLKFWTLPVVITPSLLGFIYLIYSLERDQEQPKKQHCEANSGVYMRPYKSRGICLQIVDGKLKEIE